ncbi:Proteophosphoglycan ppg4 [Mycena kentingensis (nom. inval.)]|nr:Proteophosphoglycan ppg4 [Mycena kentingensis (nom. inval.)]
MYISLPRRAVGSGEDPNHVNMPISTWVPVVVVVGVLVLLSFAVCVRRRLHRAANAASTAPGAATRELTAEQLAGLARCPLPAYAKEPGELELVVVRGPDGEDMAIPAATVPAEDDDRSNDEHDRVDADERPEGVGAAIPTRQSTVDNARYTEMPQSPHDTPLLAADPRGEAPAYFEVVDEPQEYPPGIETTVAPQSAVVPGSPVLQTPSPVQRRSGFFSIFRPAPEPAPVPTTPSALTPSASATNLALTHTRTRSTTGGGGHSPSPSGSRHRSSPSASTLFSLGLGRRKSTQSLSASPQNNALTSPSLISLASISSPLPHTLVKTEFTSLPKAGMTPEQFRLISGNKDGGLGRFGVPFGDVAVAFASANASRVGLDDADADAAPPPGWEEVAGAGASAPEADAEAGPLNLRPLNDEPQPEAEHFSSDDDDQEEPNTDFGPPPPEVFVTVASRANSTMSGRSIASFATAQEGGDDEDDETRPGAATHLREETDATVRP